MVRYNTSINVSLDDGETERFVVETGDVDAVRVDLSAGAQPYDVDIATAPMHRGQGSFDANDYVGCLPQGVETYTDTNEHTTATDVVAESVYVEITNNSGGSAVFSGSISTHSPTANVSTARFATEGTSERAMGWRDGKALANAETVGSDHLDVSGWKVKDVVKHGVDPTGSRDAVDRIKALAEDNTLLVFPEGTYFIDQWLDLHGYDGLGLVAKGDATIEVGANTTGGEGSGGDVAVKLGSQEYQWGDNLLFEGFTIDLSANQQVGAFGFAVTDKAVVRDITVTGTAYNQATKFEVQNEEGAALIERVRLPDGSVTDAESPHLKHGLRVAVYSRGTIRFRDCYVEGFYDNGLYGRQGRIIVEGGTFKNNGTSSVRVQEGPSVIRDVEIINDANPHPSNGAYRGLYLKGEGVVVENVRIDATDFPGTDSEYGGRAIHCSPESGALTLRDIEVHLGDLSTAALEIEDHVEVWGDDTSSSVPSPHVSEHPGVIVDNLHVEGSGDASQISEAVKCGRSESVFRDCIVDVPTATQDTLRQALRIYDADNVRVEGGTYISDRRTIGVGQFNGLAQGTIIRDVYAEAKLAVVDEALVVWDGSTGTKIHLCEFVGGTTVETASDVAYEAGNTGLTV